MFGLFSKKEKPVPVTDLVWINAKAKQAGLLKIVQENPGAVFVAWFENTAAEAENYLRSNGTGTLIHTSRQLHGSHTNGKEVYFLEHYPLFQKEQELFRKSEAGKITVLTALDEPLIKQFGGDRIASVMTAMGVQEGESISHALISSSIQKAQQKLEKEITVEMQAVSAEEWFRKNRPVK